MELANSRRRIVVNATMGFLFLFGSVAIIQEYSKRRKEHTLVSLHDRNVQRYEKLKEEEAATETGNEKQLRSDLLLSNNNLFLTLGFQQTTEMTV